MGRHNTIAGRMATSAAARGRLFTKLAREIMVAARNGSDVSANSALRAAVAKAKDNSMPKENIERCIKKGAGESGAATHYEEVLYEGFTPGGAAVMVEVLTDNRNRTFPEIRRLFQKLGGNLGEMGIVNWMFVKKGVFIIDSKRFTEDVLMNAALEAGADDVQRDDDYTTILCAATDFSVVREALLAAHISFEKAGLEYIATTETELSGETLAQAEEFLEKIQDHDDVQNVYSNIA